MVLVPFPLVALGVACVVGVLFIVFWAVYIWFLEGSWLAKRRQELADLWSHLKR